MLNALTKSMFALRECAQSGAWEAVPDLARAVSTLARITAHDLPDSQQRAADLTIALAYRAVQECLDLAPAGEVAEACDTARLALKARLMVAACHSQRSDLERAAYRQRAGRYS